MYKKTIFEPLTPSALKPCPKGYSLKHVEGS